MAQKKKSGWLMYGWMAIVIAGLIVGLWGAVTLLVKGHVVGGATDQIPWGIFVPTYVFFVAASAGCVLVSLGYALGMQRFELVMKRAIFLGIVTLIAGGIIIFLDLGKPTNAFNFFFSPTPNFNSPMWWMSLWYSTYLVLLVVEFVLLHKHKVKAIKVVGVFAGLAAIAVHSTLGSIFGFATVRTYFGGALAPVYFILIAIIIGTAMLLLVTIIEHKAAKKKMIPELSGLMLDLGKFLGVVVSVAVFFTIWKDLVGIRSSIATTSLAYEHILSTWWYWVVVLAMGLIIPLFLLLNSKTRNLNLIMVASTLVLIGMFAARVEFTLGGQIVALVPNLQHLQWPFASYTPTFNEIAVSILAFSISAALYTAGIKKLALGEVSHHE